MNWKRKTTKMKQLKTYILSLLMLLALDASAQCTFNNTAFNSGEYLTYNLYYNWKFVWVKAGTASWYTVASTYHGTPAYRASLTTRGNGRLDDYFVLRDTLLCYDTKDLVPLYFRKGAREGKRYTVDEVFYSYPNGKAKIKQHRIDNDGKHHWKEKTQNDCVFDMMSIFLRARSFNTSGWKKGNFVNFSIADGNSLSPGRVIYNGKATIKADNGRKYRCLQLAYDEQEKGKWKNIAKFYVTDDANHIPIRLDMSLKFGSAKAFLVSMKGVRSKITSEVK